MKSRICVKRVWCRRVGASISSAAALVSEGGYKRGKAAIKALDLVKTKFKSVLASHITASAGPGPWEMMIGPCDGMLKNGEGLARNPGART